MNRKVVYTAITKGYDKLKEPKVVSDIWDYICFTDDPNLTSKVWQVIYVEDLNHKEPKMLPHKYLKYYDYWLWIDGSIEILVDPSELLSEMFRQDVDFMSFNAKMWNTPFDEGKAVVSLGYETLQNVEKVFNKFAVDFPRDKLTTCTVILRKNIPKINKFNELWNSFMEYSKRDQLSIDYCLWKEGIKQGYFEGSIYENKYFKWRQQHG